MKLTLIGNGSMALALAKGLKEKYELEVLGRDINKLETFKEKVGDITVGTVQDSSDITDKNIILCVKPHSLDDVSRSLKGKAKTLFSVLAGTTLEKLQNSIEAHSYVRAMPNLSAAYLKSMTTLTGDEILKEEAENIFNEIGDTLWVGSEKELDIATAVAGSGPAYLALIAEALSDGGVKCGLKRDDSLKLVRGLFNGFAPLLENESPSGIKDGVMSPAGTTAAGYSALEEEGVRNGMIKAIEAAYDRACELGR